MMTHILMCSSTYLSSLLNLKRERKKKRIFTDSEDYKSISAQYIKKHICCFKHVQTQCSNPWAGGGGGGGGGEGKRGKREPIVELCKYYSWYRSASSYIVKQLAYMVGK